MKIWLDDIRKPPDDSWVWVVSARGAIAQLLLSEVDDDPVELISFDHDLGSSGTSMKVAEYIEKRAFERAIKPPRWQIHSANPVGRANLKAALERSERLYEEQKKV